MSSFIDKKKEELKPALTPEFLQTLIELARVVGHTVDYSEINEFVSIAHDIAGVDSEENWDYNNPPEPYEHDEED